MNKEKSYNGILNIGEKNISIDTKHYWMAIEITMSRPLEINSLLPDDYIVEAGRNKIIVVRVNSRKDVVYDLFEYRGIASFIKCEICLNNLQLKKLYINNSSLQLWNTLSKTIDGSSSTQKDWAYLGENWEDLDFDGNNDKQYYTFRKQTYDKEEQSYTDIYETRKK